MPLPILLMDIWNLRFSCFVTVLLLHFNMFLHKYYMKMSLGYKLGQRILGQMIAIY